MNYQVFWGFLFSVILLGWLALTIRDSIRSAYKKGYSAGHKFASENNSEAGKLRAEAVTRRLARWEIINPHSGETVFRWN